MFQVAKLRHRARQLPAASSVRVCREAPVLVLPRVFEPWFCRHLIDLYEAQGGQESGFMRQVDGRTVGVMDPGFKVRRDVVLSDAGLIAAIQTRFLRRVVPEILKVHQYRATRMERYIVSCYAADEGGQFLAHRDNTTAGTAQRTALCLPAVPL